MVHARYPTSQGVGEAVQLLDRALTLTVLVATHLPQIDMMQQPSPVALALIRPMYRDDGLKPPVARSALAEYLDCATRCRRWRPSPRPGCVRRDGCHRW